jgi:hypothetical protein
MSFGTSDFQFVDRMKPKPFANRACALPDRPMMKTTARNECIIELTKKYSVDHPGGTVTSATLSPGTVQVGISMPRKDDERALTG